jgi:hypothetical protein
LKYRFSSGKILVRAKFCPLSSAVRERLCVSPSEEAFNLYQARQADNRSYKLIDLVAAAFGCRHPAKSRSKAAHALH